MDEVLIVGGGICGLALALNLHARGIACRVYERAPEMKELGVGITLLPHAMREFTALGLGDELLRAGIENAESCFFNRFGQLIYKEPRGKARRLSVSRSRHPSRPAAHDPLSRRAASGSAPDCIVTDRACVGVEQDERGARVLLQETISGRDAAAGRGRRRRSPATA